MCYLCGATEKDVRTHTCIGIHRFYLSYWKRGRYEQMKIYGWCFLLYQCDTGCTLGYRGFHGVVLFVMFLCFGRKFLMFLSFVQCRCGFYLHPAEGSPAPNITQGKLSAPRILRIHKVRCSQNHWSTANARCCEMVNPPIHNDISGGWCWMEESALRGENFLCQQSTVFACMLLWHQNSLLPIYICLHVSVKVANCIVFFFATLK